MGEIGGFFPQTVSHGAGHRVDGHDVAPALEMVTVLRYDRIDKGVGVASLSPRGFLSTMLEGDV